MIRYKYSDSYGRDEEQRPMDGLWLVTDDGKSMTWLGDVHPISRLRFDVKAAIIQKSDELSQYIHKTMARPEGFSTSDLLQGLSDIIAGR